MFVYIYIYLILIAETFHRINVSYSITYEVSWSQIVHVNVSNKRNLSFNFKNGCSESSHSGHKNNNSAKREEKTKPIKNTRHR